MKKTLLIITAILCATSAFAGDDNKAREQERKFFTFGDHDTDEQNSTICHSPKKPDFIKELSLEERLIIGTLYRTLVSKSIIEQNYCTCDMLYPTYDKAIEVFQKEFVPIGLPTKPGTEESEYTRKFINAEPYSYSKAVHICISQGVS